MVAVSVLVDIPFCTFYVHLHGLCLLLLKGVPMIPTPGGQEPPKPPPLPKNLDKEQLNHHDPLAVKKPKSKKYGALYDDTVFHRPRSLSHAYSPIASPRNTSHINYTDTSALTRSGRSETASKEKDSPKTPDPLACINDLDVHKLKELLRSVAKPEQYESIKFFVNTSKQLEKKSDSKGRSQQPHERLYIFRLE